MSLGYSYDYSDGKRRLFLFPEARSSLHYDDMVGALNLDHHYTTIVLTRTPLYTQRYWLKLSWLLKAGRSLALVAKHQLMLLPSPQTQGSVLIAYTGHVGRRIAPPLEGGIGALWLAKRDRRLVTLGGCCPGQHD